MFLKEFIEDKLSHSDTKDLDVVIDSTLEWLQRAGYLTEHQKRIIVHDDVHLNPRRANPPIPR